MNQFITDQETDDAVHYLSSSAEKHARAKAKVKYLEKHVKSVLAIESLKQKGKSMTENKTRAEATTTYKDILADYEIAVYEFTLVDDKRFAAEAIIDAWKVISYSMRRGNI